INPRTPPYFLHILSFSSLLWNHKALYAKRTVDSTNCMADLYLKARIKLGDNEFEADGPVDIVRAEIDGFKRLIGFKAETGDEEGASAARKSRADIEKISRIQGRIVSLKLQTKSAAHAVLAVLLGQQLLRNNTSVMGSEIMDGLRQS